MKIKKWIIITILIIEGLFSCTNVQATMFTTLGDSLSVGWLPEGVYTTPYGQYAADYLGMTFHQSSQASNMFRKGYKTHPDRYFESLIKNNKSSLKEAKVILICEGTNDYNRNTPLSIVKENMTKGLQLIKSYNNNALIIGVLPPERWLPKKGYAPGLTTYNNQGYTLQDLRITEQQIYSEFNIPTTTFKQMGFNYTKNKTADGLHLKADEHRNLGKVVAKYIGKQSPHKQYNYYIKVSNDAAIYDNLGFTNQVGTAHKGDLYAAKEIYTHPNGHEYLSLYQNNQWIGYINKDFTQSTNVKIIKVNNKYKNLNKIVVSTSKLNALTNTSGF